MPTLIVYSDGGSNDGQISSGTTDYPSTRSGAGLSADTSSTSVTIGQWGNGGTFNCWEAFFSFDTSFVGFASSVSSVTFSLYGASGGDLSFQDFTIEARMHDWGTSLTTADWVAGASLSALTSVATFATSGGFSTSAYNDFTNVAFPANINKSGSTRIICYSSRHSGNNTPSTYEEVVAYSADQTGTANDPKLLITYTETTNQIKKVAGVSNIS